MQKLDQQELQQLLSALPQWALAEGVLVREWRCRDFVAAMAFVNRVAALAEEEAHHPDIDIRYNCVRLALVTHDAGGVTARDGALAAKIDHIETS